MGAASQRIPQGAVHFVARSADKNVPHARGRAGKLPPFRPGHTDLPAHLQIRKLFFKKVLAQFSNHRLLSSTLNARVQQNEARINNIACRSGGIGRRASLRC